MTNGTTLPVRSPSRIRESSMLPHQPRGGASPRRPLARLIVLRELGLERGAAILKQAYGAHEHLFGRTAHATRRVAEAPGTCDAIFSSLGFTEHDALAGRSTGLERERGEDHLDSDPPHRRLPNAQGLNP